jgi:hypothetical protein
VTQSKSCVLLAVALLASFSFAAASGQKISIPAPSVTSSSSVTSQDDSILPDSPSAQAAQQAPARETDEQRKARERAESEAQVKREEHQRNFGIIPNFNTVLGGRVPPLTPGQKFDLVYHTAKDPYTITLAFIVAGLGEAEDSDSGDNWWGPYGYLKRVGASYADNVDGALIGNAILPSLLHQDPRYYRKGTGPIMSRVIHSALSTVICLGDNGKRQFNVSNVAGNFIAGGVSNLYYPAAERGVGLTFENGAEVTAEGVVGAQILEFAPDISAYIHRRREHHRLMKQQQRDQQAGIAPKTP